MSNEKQSSIDKEFVPYAEALVLKELGLNEPCFGYWKSKNWLIQEKTRTDGYTHADQECSAPTFSQAFRWFREKYDLDYYIYRNDDDLINYVKNKGVVDLFKYRCGYSDSTSHPIKGCYTHEEAELECLKKLIEVAKEKQNEKQ